MKQRGFISAAALLVACMPPLPAAITLRPVEGAGQRSVETMHANIERAHRRRYDIHKIGAKTRARMEKATQDRLARIHNALERGLY